jgi:hypothetical protein
VIRIVSAGLLSYILSQASMQMEPLRTELRIFSENERLWVISPFCALVSMFTLALARQIWRRYNKNPYATILLVGVLVPLMLVIRPARGTVSPHVTMDVVLGMLELVACITPGALLAQWLTPNIRIDRDGEG